MPLEDKESRLRVMREIAKYDMETSFLDVKVINQVAYLGGRISRIRRIDAPENLRKILEEIEDTLRAMKGINDVVMEVRID